MKSRRAAAQLDKIKASNATVEPHRQLLKRLVRPDPSADFADLGRCDLPAGKGVP